MSGEVAVLRTSIILLLVLLIACGPGERQMDSQVVYRDSAGRALTLDDVRTATGVVRWEIPSRRDVPEEAQRLHQLGRETGATGDYGNALALFSRAAALAPDWPYPLYDAAYTHLLMGDFAAALQEYRRTIALAPRGFFTALTAVDVLEREEAGELPVGIYLAYSQVEWIEDPTAKEARVRELLAAAPAFAPGWKELVSLLEDDAARLDAIERGLAAHPDAETRGILLINRALVLFNQGERDDAIEILGSLALDPASSLGAAEQAKAALAILVQQDAGQ